MKIKLAAIKSKEIMPGYHGKLTHALNMNLAFWEVGSKVPEHKHINE